ncbi:1,4-alpha-glucan branching protein [soil metagenome]
MVSNGAFTFVLHSHLPYAREAGMWPHGEEWVHEGISETYLPLLDALYDLKEEGVDYRITVSVTPILAEQLGDPLIADHFETFAEERATWAAADVERFTESGDAELKRLAEHYHAWYSSTLKSFRSRHNRDILGALKTLQDEGYIEISTCAATHGYLPLLGRDSSIFAQLRTGIRSYERSFGRKPTAIWLPECAYRPGRSAEETVDGIVRPSIETFLKEQGIRVFFTETHTVEGGRPVGKAAGEAIGPYGEVYQRITVEPSDDLQDEPGTTYKAYWVGDAAGDVAVLARNNRTGQQVWSGTFGYPGDAAYREFHRKDGVSGMQYWAIGAPGTDLGEKPLYNPDLARERTESHADHFAHLVEDLLEEYRAGAGKPGVISSNYDTELFGHWWFEGVAWLKRVLLRLAQSDKVDLTTATQMVNSYLPDRVVELPESSWGAGGNHSTWMNPETEWMWPVIHGAERRMEALVAENTDPDDDVKRVLAQAGRELLLLQSSDWPFLVTTGQANEYATKRFREHVERFDLMAETAESGELGPGAREQLELLERRDNPFPTIDYRDFAERQGHAEIQ